MGESQTPNTRITRDTRNKMLGGVCAGIARRYEYDVTVVRVVAVLLTLVWGAGILLYLALWVIIPADEPTPAADDDATAEAAASEMTAFTPAASAAASIDNVPAVADDLAERARRAAEEFTIAARAAAEAARVAAEQLAAVARAATAAGRESWEQQRTERQEPTPAAPAAPPAPEAPAAPEDPRPE
jgi:phage shock protein PspC (stress-responsive transcriptional regulator)